MDKNKYKTINTFSRTPSPAQIVSYTVILLQIIIFYVMLMNSLVQSTTKIIFTVLYSCSIVSVFITTFICSLMDPSDSTMIACKNGQRNKFSDRLSELLYCDFCDAFVQINSRHCRQCNRCVQNFDHHCIWINNCVGTKNYKIFIAMIISTFVNMIIFLVAVLVVSIQDQWKQFLGFMITSWSLSFIVIILAILLVNLILLHIYLICKGYTTYQFIIARREQQKKNQMNKIRQKNNRKKSQRQMSQNQIKKKSQIRTENNMQQEIVRQSAGTLNQDHSNFHSNSNSHVTPIKSLKGINGRQANTMLNTNINPVQYTNQQLQQTNNALLSNNQNQNQKDRNPKDTNVKQFIEGDQNIFGGSQNEKSETISIKMNPINQEREDQSRSENHLNENQNNVLSNRKKQTVKRKQTDQYAENTDEEAQSIKMSQFFTRNKSLSIFIGKQLASKPKKKNVINSSVYVRGTNYDQNGQIKTTMLASDTQHKRISSASGNLNEKNQIKNLHKNIQSKKQFKNKILPKEEQ